MTASTLQPTLWRTCRTLANHNRLRLMGALVRKQPQTVTALAEQVGLSLPQASMALRALESRGLLSVRRIRRQVEYRLPDSGANAGSPQLLDSLFKTLKNEDQPITLIYRLTTAFTHPARIMICRRLAKTAATQGQLAAMLQLSWPATTRHINKLAARGYLVANGDCYELIQPSEPVGRALLKLALR